MEWTDPIRITIKDGGAATFAYFPNQKMLFQVKAIDVKSLSSELKKEKLRNM